MVVEEYTTKRDEMLRRWAALKNERSSWDSHWSELAEYLLPGTGNFSVGTDPNKGSKVHGSIYDNTATRALRVTASGIMANMTSPARPWFRLGVRDPLLAEYHPVKVWLEDVAKVISRVFSKSNTYRALHQMYEELVCYGTACSIVLPNFETVIHHYPVTVGEFAAACNAEGQVDTFYREFRMTVAQMVKQFGLQACSTTVRDQFQRGTLDAYHSVIHAIEPREDRDPEKGDARNMPWRSCHFELSCPGNQVLRESGFEHFPVLMPRWATKPGDVYGRGPGMDCLGDVKQLQHMTLALGQAVNKQVDPPLAVPAGMINRDIDTLPGGITFVGQTGPQNGIRSLYDVQLNTQHHELIMQQIRQRVDEGFFKDLFLMLHQANKNGMTATEVAARAEEKLVMLGPCFQRLSTELLEPLVDMTFDRLLEAGALPPAPPELSGEDLSVEFISVMAQAQRAIGANSVDRWLSTVGSVAQMKPEALDKVDVDAVVDAYGDMLGVDPTMIVPGDKVQALRDARNKANAAKEQAAMMQQQADTAAKLGTVSTGAGANNAAADLMNSYTGYSSPSPQQV